MAHFMYFENPEEKGQTLSWENVQEERGKGNFEAKIRVASYQITKETKQFFKKHCEGKTPQKIIFFNKLAKNIDITPEFIARIVPSEKKKVLTKKDGIKNSAEAIVLVY